jgi:hypothetical protein
MMFMTECLGVTDPDCGLLAVQTAAKERELLIDYDPAIKGQRLILGPGARKLLEAVDILNIQGSGIHDIAEFGCVAYGRCIKFEDDDADYLVDGELMSVF